MTPPEVDDLFSAAWDRRYGLVMSTFDIWDDLHYAVNDRRTGRRSWRLSHAEAKAKVDQSMGSLGSAVRVLAKLHTAQGRIAELDNTILAKLNTEFDRRGGWTRAYLVTDGHVHRSMHCSTCNNGESPTRFFWMIDYSGKTEDEIIEAAGERACTICYPDAPVARRDREIPKSVMLTPEEVKRARLREEEAARREEKKAKAALGAITRPDGTRLCRRIDKDGVQRGDLIKTLRTARTELKRECWQQHGWGDEGGWHEVTIQHLARSIAWKENGLPVGTEPTQEQIDAAIEPLRKAAIKEFDKERARG
jgi:hypothetical protein